MGLQSKTSIRVTDIPRYTSVEEFRAFVKQLCAPAAKTPRRIARIFKSTRAEPTQGYQPPSDLETNHELQGLDAAHLIASREQLVQLGGALGESLSRADLL
jgi:hypothetical protein